MDISCVATQDREFKNIASRVTAMTLERRGSYSKAPGLCFATGILTAGIEIGNEAGGTNSFLSPGNGILLADLSVMPGE